MGFLEIRRGQEEAAASRSEAEGGAGGEAPRNHTDETKGPTYSS